LALFRDTSWFGTATHSATRSTRTDCALDVNDIAMGNCIPPLSPLPGGRTLLEADESELLAQDAAA
jgi:hypothetical protein